ncbi:aspartate aminotransferase family protein [uncultured Mailhella sp.]|uniref:aspartate aminotransferase family protein n=1 Tax=uncultured Mailhella sp. TaxID=1981031 RepID=UPI00263533D8|nr:aspartate aminotransferase family protein [uncultured Mailhella sp.]
MSEAFERLKERERAFMCRTYSRYPVSVVRGKGSRLWDIDGREYVDLLSGIAVVALGHANEELAEVMAQQARKLIHVSNLFYQEEQLDYAEKLLATSHAGKVFFCNSGAESNEAAIKLARRYQKEVKGRDAWEVITLENCFHGRTMATLAATGKHVEGFEPLPAGFGRVPWNDLDALEKAIRPSTAAVLIEAVQGEGGIFPVTQEYADGLAEICRRHGVLLLCDEVQAGMCRSGRWWSFQHFGLKPDIFTSSKSMANGLPLGAMMATDEAAQGFDYGSHATTFGGGALVTAVGLKVLEIMERDHLAERAAELGDRARARFRALGERLPGAIADVRGKGLLIGVQLDMPQDAAKKVWEKLLEKGFILNLTYGSTLRFLPALTIDESDLADVADALENILRQGV